MMKSIGHICGNYILMLLLNLTNLIKNIAQLHNVPVSDQFISMKVEFPPSADVKEFMDELKEEMPYFNHPFVKYVSII